MKIIDKCSDFLRSKGWLKPEGQLIAECYLVVNRCWDRDYYEPRIYMVEPKGGPKKTIYRCPTIFIARNELIRHFTPGQIQFKWTSE